MPPQGNEGEKVIEIRSFGGYGGEGVRQSQALARRAGEVGGMQKLGISGRLHGTTSFLPIGQNVQAVSCAAQPDLPTHFGATAWMCLC